MATAIDTSTDPESGRHQNQGDLFVMSDGNSVCFYANGTNFGYRIKTAGVWGAFTAVVGLPSPGYAMTRNGDTFYALVGINTVSSGCILYKFVYAAGAITTTSVSLPNPTDVNNYPIALGIFWDSTNSFVHVWVNHLGAASTPFYVAAYNASLTQTIAPTVPGTPSATSIATSGVVGNGSTLYLYSTTGTVTLNVNRLVAGASSYSTNAAETGVTAWASQPFGVCAALSVTSIYFFGQNQSTIENINRSGVNTYSASAPLLTSGTVTLPTDGQSSVCILSGTGDLVLFFTLLTGQANGEIYYLRRRLTTAGTNVWDASPGTRLVGAAATGWHYPIASTDETNSSRIARVRYSTGTASPWTVIEDSVFVPVAAASVQNGMFFVLF